MKKVEENTYYDCLYHQFLNETHSESNIDSIDFIKWIYSKKVPYTVKNHTLLFFFLK